MIITMTVLKITHEKALFLLIRLLIVNIHCLLLYYRYIGTYSVRMPTWFSLLTYFLFPSV